MTTVDISILEFSRVSNIEIANIECRYRIHTYYVPTTYLLHTYYIPRLTFSMRSMIKWLATTGRFLFIYFNCLFRDDPPSESVRNLVAELSSLDTDSLCEVDPIKEFNIRDIDLRDNHTYLRQIEATLGRYECIQCSTFSKHVSDCVEV